MAHDVFISYAAEDKPIADMICAVAERRGIRCWMAPRDIAPGADWRESILTAIRAGRGLVLVFSEHANASRHVNREVDCAIEAGLPVVPFRTQDIGPRGSLEYSLYGVHWLDAVTPPLEAHATRLAELLRSMLAVQGTHAAPPEVVRERAVPAPRQMSGAAMATGGLAIVAALGVGGYFMFAGDRKGEVVTPAAPLTSAAATPSPAVTSLPTPAAAPDAPAGTPLPTPTDAQPASAHPLVFQTEQAQLLWSIKSDRANDFEQVWSQILDGLRRSDQVQSRQLAHQLKLFRLPAGATAMYSLRINPVVPSVDYGAGHLLVNSGRFDRASVESLYTRLTDSLVSLNAVPCEPVNLLPLFSGPANPAGGAAGTKMLSGADVYTFTVDEAEIWFNLKPGQRQEFESVWREVFAGLVRSANPEIRRIARGISVFRVTTGAVEWEIFRITSVVKGLSYDPALLVRYAAGPSRNTENALMARLSSAVDAINAVPLTIVR
jgi:hypothetical protein